LPFTLPSCSATPHPICFFSSLTPPPLPTIFSHDFLTKNIIYKKIDNLGSQIQTCVNFVDEPFVNKNSKIQKFKNNFYFVEQHITRKMLRTYTHPNKIK
jgi:hypothetical protein